MSRAIFLKGDLKKHLFNLTLPSAISLFVSFSFMLADTFFIARLGHNQVAAIGYAFIVFEWIVGLSVGFGIAVTTCIGQSLGRKRPLVAQNFAFVGLLLMLFIGIIITVVGKLTIAPLFYALGADDVVMPYIQEFMSIWYWGAVPFLAFFLFSFACRSYGFAKTVMIVGLISTFINLVLDPVLIFGLFGFPQLGVAGAALAGLIARLITVVICFYILFEKKILRFFWSYSRCLIYLDRLFKIAVPAIFTNLIPAVLITATTFFLAKFSQEAVAAYGIGSRIQAITVIPLFALSGSVNAIVAQNYGARDLDRVIRTLNLSLLFSLIWGVSVAIIFVVFADYIITPFHQTDEVNQVIYSFLYIFPISFTGWGVIMMVAATFNAINKPVISMFINILRAVVIYIPVGFILMSLWGYIGVFVALTFSNIVTGFLAWLLSVYYFSRVFER